MGSFQTSHFLKWKVSGRSRHIWYHALATSIPFSSHSPFPALFSPGFLPPPPRRKLESKTESPLYHTIFLKCTKYTKRKMIPTPKMSKISPLLQRRPNTVIQVNKLLQHSFSIFSTPTLVFLLANLTITINRVPKSQHLQAKGKIIVAITTSTKAHFTCF